MFFLLNDFPQKYDSFLTPNNLKLIFPKIKIFKHNLSKLAYNSVGKNNLILVIKLIFKYNLT